MVEEVGLGQGAVNINSSLFTSTVEKQTANGLMYMLRKYAKVSASQSLSPYILLVA